MTDQEPFRDAYRRAGVDYETLDAGKRLAMASALATSHLLGARGGRSLDRSRGEPASVFELGQQTLALVLEGLGTKSIIARQVQEQLGINRFAYVAYDAVAAILNDLSCVGALPLVVNAYFATGSSDWYREPDRPRPCSTAGSGRASMRGVSGGRRVAVAGRAGRRARDRARRLCRRGAGARPSADPRRGAPSRAMRSCCSLRAGFTPTAPRSRADRRAAARRLRDAAPRGRDLGEALLLRPR